MTAARFANPEALALLWALPVVAAALVAGYWLRRRSLRRFASAAMVAEVAPGVSRGRAAARGALVLASLGLAVVAMARPQGEPERGSVERAGRDVCVIVDVSKSMLADDLAPTRLGRTKVWLNDLIDGMSGDRLAVIAMAGRPALVSPLTHDYAFARFVIEQLDPTAAGKGGTNLGDAVRLAVDEAFPDDEAVGDDAEGVQRARFRTVLLISDGGDTVDSLPVEAARAAGERGIRLVTIGIGSEAGATVPDVDPFGRPSGVVRDARGRAVVSKLDSATLRAMAEATPGGVYLDVGTRDIDLAEVYAGLMQQAAAREMEWAQGVVYEEWYGVFALGALVCLFLSEVINERRRP